MTSSAQAFSRPGKRDLERAARKFSKLRPAQLLMEAGSAWAEVWAITLAAAGLIAATGILGVAESGPPLLRAGHMVLLFATASFAESAVLWAAARHYMGARFEFLAPWKQAFRIFGEVFLVELCFWALIVLLLGFPLSTMGPQPQPSGGNGLLMMAFLIPALYIGTRWSLAKEALILEAPGPFAALRASWRASEGRVPLMLGTWIMAGFPLVGLNLLLRHPKAPVLNPVLDAGLWFFHGLLVTWLSFVGTALYLSLRRPAVLPSAAAS